MACLLCFVNKRTIVIYMPAAHPYSNYKLTSWIASTHSCISTTAEHLQVSPMVFSSLYGFYSIFWCVYFFVRLLISLIS